MMKRAIVTVAMLLGAARAGAQTCTANLPGSCSMTYATSMVISKVVDASVNAATTVLTAPGATEFNNGFALDNGPTVTFKANTPWQAYIRGGAAFWTATNTKPGVTAWTTKPVGNLQWSLVNGSGYAAFTTSDVALASGNKTPGTLVPLFLKTLYAWTTDTPGKYDINVVLTIVAP